MPGRVPCRDDDLVRFDETGLVVVPFAPIANVVFAQPLNSTLYVPAGNHRVGPALAGQSRPAINLSSGHAVTSAVKAASSRAGNDP